MNNLPLDFKQKKQRIDKIAASYSWSSLPSDESNGRISYIDELNVYRIDIYTSKMTVCILPKGDKPTYMKRQNFDMIDNILKNPFVY